MTLTIIKYLNYSPYLDEKVSGGNNSVIIGASLIIISGIYVAYRERKIK